MKKRILLIVSILLFNCKTLKVCNPNKTNISQKTEINGKWIIESITDRNKNKFTSNLPLLNDVSFLCFDQSTWNFNPLTNSGEYYINDLYCKFGKRKFNFHHQDVTQENVQSKFTLKEIWKKGKKITDKSFEIKLVKISGQSMRWEYDMISNSKAIPVTISFKKIKKTTVTER